MGFYRLDIIVDKARDLVRDEVVALKKIRLEAESKDADKKQQSENQASLPNDGLPISHFREIQLLRSLTHQNVVAVKSIVVSPSNLGSIFTVMEFCTHDLAALIDSMKNPFTQGEIKCLMSQLLRGLEYCHRKFIIHRDLKLSNLLLAHDGTLKIADFGLARKFGSRKNMTPNVVTLWYRAPEVLFGDSRYTVAIDMWSVGCIFGELLAHRPLLPGHSELQQLTLISQLLGTPTPVMWPSLTTMPLYGTMNLPSIPPVMSLKKHFDLIGEITENTNNLLMGLLCYDPSRRYNVFNCLDHPYFMEAPRKVDKSLIRTFPDQRDGSSVRSTNKVPAQPPIPPVAIPSAPTSTNAVESTSSTIPLSAYLKRRKDSVN